MLFYIILSRELSHDTLKENVKVLQEVTEIKEVKVVNELKVVNGVQLVQQEGSQLFLRHQETPIIYKVNILVCNNIEKYSTTDK